MKHRNYALAAFGALVVLAVAACGGGSTTPATQFPLPSPPIGAGSLLGAASPAPFTLAASNGLAPGTITIKGTGTIGVTQSTKNPSGLQALSVRSLANAAKLQPKATDPNTPIAYLTVTATSATTLDGFVTINLTPTATPPPGPYYEAFWNGKQWVTFGSTGKFANGVLTFGSANVSPAATLTAGQSYYVVAYTGVLLTTPTPPPPAPVASPTSLTLFNGSTATFTVTSNPNSTVTATSKDITLATVSASETTDKTTGMATFTVTANATNVGTTTITVTDQVGQTTLVTVNVSNVPPVPNATPLSATLGLGDQTTIHVPSKPGATITVSLPTASPGVLTISPAASATADPATGYATFTVTAANPGTETVTFHDAYSQTGTFTGTVSNIRNGAFTSGLTSWTPCSYPHTPLTAPVNESTPMPVSPAATQSPGAATAAITTGLTALAAVVSPPPPNDNPSPPAGITSPAPAAIGSDVALVGTLNASSTPVPKGEFGICQSVTVSASTPYLSFWVWEGGQQYNLKYADFDVEVLNSASTTIQQTLFAEQHCYIHPPNLGAPGAAASSGCWPAAYGGDTGNFKDWIGGGYWSLRGPYDLSAYATQTVTLYFGQWSNFTNTASTQASFIYLGNVQMMPTTTVPTAVPLARRAAYSVQLIHH